MSNKQPSTQPPHKHPPASGEVEQQPRIKRWFQARLRQASELFPLNLAWLVLSLPALTIFPALGGLYYAVLAHQQGEPSGWRTVWEGFRKYWLISVQWGVLVLLGYLACFSSIWFFREGTKDWHPYAAAAGVVFAIIWATINQFSFPLLLIQKKKNILFAIRNGYVILVRRRQESIKVLLLVLAIYALSTVVPPLWILVTMALIAQIQTRHVLKSVEKIREADRERDTAQAFRHSGEHDQEQSEPEK